MFKRFQNHQSRKLTNGEKMLAASIFGQVLNVDDIEIKTAWWVLKNYAVSPNGNLYFHPDNWIEDFSQQPLGRRAWFIHELTHVWQIQQGIKVFRKAVFDRRYKYAIKQGKSFFNYGVEQQARMVEDYYIRCQTGQKCDDLKALIPFALTPNNKNINDISKSVDT
ncbi:MAG: type IV secretion protein Rhs [Gammaproteobacteria bacterium]|nr:MAG: type IV secretion protein Rhs [Gammaproteobacteria bacterium]